MKYETFYSKELVQDLKAVMGLDPQQELFDMMVEELKIKFANFWDNELQALKDSEYSKRPETDQFKVSIEWIENE